jgi:hypothetical protein
MATHIIPDGETGAIEADVVYTVRTEGKPVDETFGPSAMRSRNEGETESRRVTIHDGRPLRSAFELDRHGFEFVDHPTKMRNFQDPDELESVYYPEIEQLIKDRTGASRVVIFDHTLRAGDEATREERKIRGPVRMAHNDYTEWSGPERVRVHFPADEAEALLRKRFAIVQVWRAINRPIELDPLAIAEADSLADADLIPAVRKHPDRVGETYRIAYNPDHRWFYFPKMRRDEALVFKVYDSETDGRARFTAHTSFVDPSCPPDANPRESIEMRTFAFFDGE